MASPKNDGEQTRNRIKRNIWYPQENKWQEIRSDLKREGKKINLEGHI